MPLTVSQANAVATVIHWFSGTANSTGATPTSEKAAEALVLLAQGANKTLMCGPYEAEARAAIAAVDQLRAELATYRGDTRHMIDLRPGGYTIAHPMSCRPNLFDCPFNEVAAETLDAPGEVGQFYCNIVDGWLAILDRVPEPGVSAPSKESGNQEDPQASAGRTAALHEHWAALDPDGTWTSGEGMSRAEAEEIVAERARPELVLAVRWESGWRVVVAAERRADG